jgi:4-cresol dehydrogenase (hydroxylating) flavoprotein subunit
VLLEDGFEPQISVSLATERAAICVITIAFDRDAPGEDQRALACHDRLTRELIAQGYPPYRLATSTMHYAQQADAYGDVLSTLKRALDPKGVLSPGRYDGLATEAATSAKRTA